MKNLLRPRTPTRVPRPGPSTRRPRPGTRPGVERLEDRLCPDTVTLNYVDSGWWTNLGIHDATNKNYLAGRLPPSEVGTEFRNFFVFDLSRVALSQVVVGAQLRLFNPPNGFSSPDPTETYTLFDVSTPIPALRASGSGQTQIFADLGSGVSYGSQVVSAADNNRVVSINLNAEAVSYLNASRGGLAALGGAVTTIEGPALQVIFAFSGAPSHTRQLVLETAAPAGPFVVSSTPAGDHFGVADVVRVTFDEEIDPATFTRDKVVGFTHTGGEGVTDLLATVLAVTPVAGSGNRQFDVSFTSQFRLGNYALTIGPDIRDLQGRPMDQNFNGIAGEVPEDEYTASFTIQGPRVIASTPSGNSLGPVGSVQVTFNEPINPATFTPGQVFAFSGPNGPVDVTRIIPVPGSNNTQFVVTFTPQSTTGVYTLQIGPDIQDLFGHRMDQNQNFIEGEVPGDLYTATFGVQGPRIVSSTPSGFARGPVGSVRVTFNESMDAASFTPEQVSFTGPSGPIGVSFVAVVPNTGGTQFDIVFAPQTARGSYTMVIGPAIRDVYGNPMDQNGNLIPGEIPGDQFTTTFTIAGEDFIGADAFGHGAFARGAEDLELLGRPGTFTIIMFADDLSVPVNLGANTFTFYGRTYTGNNQLFVSSNGLITFGSANASFINTDLTSFPPQAAIAPLWTDWIKSSGTPMVLGRFEDVDGDGTPDRLILEWNGVEYIGGSGPVTFQVSLALNTGAAEGDFLVNYADLADLDARNIPRTVGIKDSGTQGDNRLLVTFNTVSPFVATGQAILFATSTTKGGAGNFALSSGNDAATVAALGGNSRTQAAPFGGVAQTVVGEELASALVPLPRILPGPTPARVRAAAAGTSALDAGALDQLFASLGGSEHDFAFGG